METAQQVITSGPVAVENFKQAYIFAVSKNGLGKTIKQALPFAVKLASRTIKLESIK